MKKFFRHIINIIKNIFGKDTLRTELYTSANNYFNYVYTNAGSTLETPIVKSMHKNFLDLKTIWEDIYVNYTDKKLFMYSNFTHGYPRIKRIGGNTGCELGDLLFVHIDYDSNGSSTERALLYQVKTTSGDSESEEQDILYGEWPRFKFTTPNLPNVVDVHPKQPHKGARYLYVENTTPKLDAIDRYRTKERRDDSKTISFIDEIVDLLISNNPSGRLLSDDKGWEETINEVKVYCSKKTSKGVGPRTLGLLTINGNKKGPIFLDNKSDEGLLVIYLITAKDIILTESWQEW